MADGSSGRPTVGGKKRKPGQPGHRQPAPKKRRPPNPQAAYIAGAADTDDTAESKKRLPWAMRRPLPPTYPGAKRPTPKPRTARDRLDTVRYLLIIGTFVSAVGVLGSIVGAVLALAHADAELPFGSKYSIPVEFILGLIVMYLLYTAVNGAAWSALRRGKNYVALRIAMFGGLCLLLLVVLGVVASFGQQGFLLAIAVAYALPYVLGPLILIVPVTAATGYMALGMRRQYQPGRSSQAASAPVTRQKAVRQLEAQGNVEALIGRLSSQRRAEREEAAAALARLGELSLPPLLRGLTLLGEPAAIALAMIGEPAVQPVTRGVDRGDRDMLRPLVLLAAYDTPGATDALRRCEESHADPEVREGARAALQELGSTESDSESAAVTPAAAAAFREMRLTPVVDWQACPACGGPLANGQEHVVQCAGCSRCYSDPGYQPRLARTPHGGRLAGEREASPLWAFELLRKKTSNAWRPMSPALVVPGGVALDRALMGERALETPHS